MPVGAMAALTAAMAWAAAAREAARAVMCTHAAGADVGAVGGVDNGGGGC